MGKALTLVVAAVVIVACPVEPKPESEPCPAAGPCDDGQDVDDHGFCDLEAGTWAPCLTVAGESLNPGEEGRRVCGVVPDGDFFGFVVPCGECAADWLDVDFGATVIRCPDLPTAAVVVAD
jgi:hypothetical protein